MDYLQIAKDNFEKSEGDVFDEKFKQDLKMNAQISALIAIADELRKLNQSLDNLTFYSSYGTALNVNKLGG